MTTREITTFKSTLSTFFSAMGTGTKRPGLVTKLPAITLARPEVTLDAAHIAAYNRICGFSEQHGVPMIYPQLLAFPLTVAYTLSEECPWPALGTVHVGNVIEQKAQLFAGDTVRVELQSGDLFTNDKGQGYSFDLRILRDGDVVWTARQSLLRVGLKEKSGKPYASRVQASEAPLSQQTSFDAPADIGRRYGAVSGDRNPIHLTALSAKLFGFPRAIAHGMWTKARALSCLLPDKPLEAATLAVDFKTPLFLPGRATLWSSRSGQRAEFEVRDGKGVKPHLRGSLQY